VHLVPQTNHSPQMSELIEEHLKEQNQSQPRLPGDSARPLRVILTKAEQIRVEILDKSAPETTEHPTEAR